MSNFKFIENINYLKKKDVASWYGHWSKLSLNLHGKCTEILNATIRKRNRNMQIRLASKDT